MGKAEAPLWSRRCGPRPSSPRQGSATPLPCVYSTSRHHQRFRGQPREPHPPSSAGESSVTLSGILTPAISLAGANAKCLAQFTANNWKGKAEAIARGLLAAAKVQAFLCKHDNTQPYLCNTLQPTHNICLRRRTTWQQAVMYLGPMRVEAAQVIPAHGIRLRNLTASFNIGTRAIPRLDPRNGARRA